MCKVVPPRVATCITNASDSKITQSRRSFKTVRACYGLYAAIRQNEYLLWPSRPLKNRNADDLNAQA